MTIWFYVKRLTEDFKSSKRGLGRLKSIAARMCSPPIGCDIDNLAKVALDAMNEIVYDDDKQVFHLVLYKLRDNDGECNSLEVREGSLSFQ